MKTKMLRILVFFIMLLAGFSSAMAQVPCPGASGPPVGCCACTGCAPTVVAPSICAQPGQVVVPITVQGGNFYDMAAISLELDFDAGILSYVAGSITAPNLPAGAPQPIVGTTGAGILKISWTWLTTPGSGWSLTNNQVLFNLTFNNNPGPSQGYVSALTWNMNVSEFADQNMIRLLDRTILCQTASNYVTGWVTTQMVTATASPNPVCAKGAVQLTGTNTLTLGPYTRLWTTDAPIAWLSSTSTCCPTFTPQTAGTYHVTYKVTDAYGCSDSKTITIVVNPLPSATITGGGDVCKNTVPGPTVTFCGLNGTVPYTFTYNINGGVNQTISTTGLNTCVSLTAPTTTVGTFVYNLVSVSDGNICTQPVTGSVTVTVYSLPTATITGGGAVCKNTSPGPTVTFCGASGSLLPYTFTYNINGGANQTISTTGVLTCVSLTAPTGTVGTFVYNLVSVSDGHCSQPASGSVTVTIYSLPTATIAGGGSVCKNTSPGPVVTFCGTNASLLPYTFTYNINGGANQTISTTGANLCVSLNAPTGIAGTFVYNLVSVSDANNCSTPASGSATVIIWELPTATITGGGAVCKNTSPGPTVTFCGANGLVPYTFTYNINGGANQTISTIGANLCVSLTAPTGTVGTYIYNLVSVSDGHCSQPASGSVTVTIYSLPTATIAGGASVCKNTSPGPAITFCGANGTVPYTFTYNINGGANQTITTTGANLCVSLNAPTGTVGTFVYNLVSVADNHLCSSPASGSATVVIWELPSGAISGGGAVCKNASPGPTVTFCGTSGLVPYTFTYNINGGANQTISTTGANTCVSLTAPTGTSGTFVYNLVSIVDNHLCTQPATGSATVTIYSLPTATITGGGAGCKNAACVPVNFCGANGSLLPYTFTYNINGGANQTVTTTGALLCVAVCAPTTATGTFVYNLVSVSDGHCSQPASGSVTVTIYALPSATITGGGSVCKNTSPGPTVTFCGANASLVPYTFTYNINGGVNQTISTTGANLCVSLTAPTGTVGTFVYNLISVSDGHCSQSASGSATVIIWELPSATITGGGSVCKNTAVGPTVTFCGTSGLVPYTFTYNINGGVSQTITTTGANTCVSLTAPTGSVGTFVYNLVSVIDNHLCSQPATGSATVIIWELPTATITGGGSVCKNTSPGPTVTFCGANASLLPYTFTYNINGGANQTISTTGANLCVDLTAPTGTVGTFVYNLVSVSDGHCSQSASGTATVIIWDLPTATITGGGSVCKNTAIGPTVTFCGFSGLVPYTFTYNINGGVNQTITTSGALTCVSLTAPTGAAGTFVYNLVSVTDNHLCTSPASGSATVIIWELPTATITGGGAVCQNTATGPTVTFCGASGLVPYTITYNINGGANQTIIANPCASLTAPTGTVGTFVYNLVSIVDNHLCSQPASGSVTVTIYSLPTATIAGGGSACKNTIPGPTVTFCGSIGLAPYTFTYNINGGANQTISTTGVLTCVSLNAPTGTAGTFVYNLVSVSDVNNCSKPASGSATVTIWELPTATITGNAEVCVGSVPEPAITFCGANGLAPYTFTYNINGGPSITVTTAGANTCVDVAVPTSPVGAYVYNLVSVSDANNCSQPATGLATVNVHPLPPCEITGADQVCFNVSVPCIEYAGPPQVIGLSYFWTISGNGTIVGSNTGSTICVSTGDPSAGTSFTLTLKTTQTYASGLISCSSTCEKTVTVTYRKITGYVKYPNCVNYLLQTPLNNVTVGLVLLPGSTVIQTAITDVNGYYQFINLCPGFYTVVVLQNNKVVNGEGINSTDAAQVNYWPTVAAANPIDHARFLAGDVSNDDFMGANDAQAIQGYFVNGQYKPSPPAPPLTPYFARSSWSYWVTLETVNSNPPVPASSLGWKKELKSIADITINLEGLVTGDFNESFTPGGAKSASSTLGLNYGETKKVGASQEFEMALQVTSAMEVGAISLILDIPSDLVEVKDVVLKGSNVPVSFKVSGNELRIGWYSLTPPINVAAAGDLLILKLKTTANFTEGTTFRIALASSPLNELADGSAEVISDVTLNSDIIANSPLGVNNLQNQSLNLNVYPNPFSDYTTVSYTLPFDGTVTLEIQTLLGQVLTTLVNETQTTGKHTLKVDARTMSQGVYTAILRLHNSNDEMVRTIKFVVSK